MMWSGDGWWMFGWGLHWVMSLGFLALLVWLIVALTRGGKGSAGGASGPSAPAGDSALAILRERYARGELSREQFEQMRQHLGA